MDGIDTLFSEVKQRVYESTTIDINNDETKKDRFVKITKEVADLCMIQQPQPTIDEYKRKVKEAAYTEFIEGIQGASFPQKEPPFKEPTPIHASFRTEIKDIPHEEIEKSMKLYQTTQPKSQINVREKKVIIIDTGEGADRSTYNITPNSNELTSFTATLSDTFQVPGRENGQCEIYLDSFTVSGAKGGSHSGSAQAVQTNEQYFMIGIDEFPLQSKSNYTQLNGKFIIPNDNSKGTTAAGRQNVNVLKSKKFNYLGQMNVGETFDTLNITCTLADGSTTIFTTTNNTNRLIMEFLFIPV